ncbi:hypothetical protein [Streptomyces sp. NPDC003015]
MPERTSDGTSDRTQPLERGIASWARTPSAPRASGPGPRTPPFLIWTARQGGPALGVEAAALFDVHRLAVEGPPPWER